MRRPSRSPSTSSIENAWLHKDDIAALKENIAALDKRLAVVEAGLNRVERLLWAAVIGVTVTAIRVWFPIP